MIMNQQANNPIARVLPDPGICLASSLTDRFAECLVNKPAACAYVMPFGYAFLCAHPDRSAIVAHTKQVKGQILEYDGSSK
jgi:hypothetical protein